MVKKRLLLILGILLVAGSWILAWTQISPFAVYYFPPLWVGFILSVNGLSELVHGDSLVRRMGWSFLLLFVLSIPLWWFFEYLNVFVQNWYYVFPSYWSPMEQIILKTISFSTVIPAVCSVSYFFHRFWKNESESYTARVSALKLILILAVGVFSFFLLFAYPKIFFPLLWIAPLLVLDPIGARFRFPSVVGEIAGGRWAVIVSFALGTLVTGLFWEMWNFYAFPKWFYTIPYFDFWRIFEMPILGYGGYIPFGLFIFSFTFFVFGLLGKRNFFEHWQLHRM